MGYSEIETMQLLGQCIASEFFWVMKDNEPYDEKRYVRNLKQLPKEPQK